MLKLIKCEFMKLKRKKFMLLVALSALLFPIPITVLMTMPQEIARYDSKMEAFDGLFNMVLGNGVQLLLPCVLGIIAAILFFMERDNDTFKNLRTIPVTSTQMVLAKIVVLFICAIVFSVVSFIVTTVLGSFTTEVNGLAYKLIMAVELGIFVAAGTLPLIVCVVFFSRTYIFSVLLCLFYTVFCLMVECVFTAVPKFVAWAIPIPLTTLWCAGDMVKHGINLNMSLLADKIPSTFETVMILGIMAILSVMLIDWLYKKRSE